MAGAASVFDSLAFDLSLRDGVDKAAGKGDDGFELARRMSSVIERLPRRGATSYFSYSGVVPSGRMLLALL